jgi:hypothetical protein
MQKMTLDILGVCIFDHEFNSIEGSIQKDLEAYNYVISNLLKPKNNLYQFFASKIPFINQKMEDSINTLDELVSKLMKKSKEKKIKNSMIDLMMKEGGLSNDEIRGNFYFF